MTDPRLRKHPLGFLEVIDRPTPAELSDYYARQYYQTEQSAIEVTTPRKNLAAFSCGLRSVPSKLKYSEISRNLGDYLTLVAERASSWRISLLPVGRWRGSISAPLVSAR